MLAIRHRCWTADRLIKRGLPLYHILRIVCYDQEEETVQYILTNWVFAWQWWYDSLNSIDLAHVAPRNNDNCFAEWWRKAEQKVEKRKWSGFNSAVILGVWALWNHRNKCVFDDTPLLSAARLFFKVQLRLWSFAGDIKLRDLAGMRKGLDSF